MAEIFHVVVYQPIYNGLALIISFIPGADVGIGIVAITLLVRLVLFPLSLLAIKSQIAMRRIDPDLKAIREKYKDKKEELGKKTMQLFRENKINPFAGFLLLLIQLPVIIGLYTVLLRFEAAQVSFDPAVLYPFVHAPDHASLFFLGILDLTGKSILLAVIAAATQFLYAKLLAPPKAATKPSGTPSFQESFASSMQLQMQYVFPVLLGVIAYFTSSAIALYFVTSNVFSVLQELVVQRVHGKRRDSGNHTRASQ
ncbi:MAG: YidC/Oxa1 family membrane protein insertase [bacterium]|nr:YidC/Oxa1 family membrane protein insertase [bacterium]